MEARTFCGYVITCKKNISEAIYENNGGGGDEKANI